MSTEIYKGVVIRSYGTDPGEGVYPLCFTDDLSGRKSVNCQIHDDLFSAMAYIDSFKG